MPTNLLETILKAMTPAEIAAAFTGVINVWLVVRNNIWNWFWGFLTVLLFGYVFYRASLYSSMLLQLVYFLPMQAYGYWMWKKGGPRHDDDLPISRLSAPGWGAATALSGLFTVGWGFLMQSQGAAVPYWDATATAFSIVAQFLQARKALESWYFWIAVDVLYAGYILPSQKLWVATGLYVVFFGLASAGAVEWYRLWKKQQAAMRADAVALQESQGR
jgi:nicotinamide mononucleotide transporter PnuC